MSLSQCPQHAFHVVAVQRKTGLTVDVVIECTAQGFIVTGVVEEAPRLIQFVTTVFLTALEFVCKLVGRPITFEDVVVLDMAGAA